MHPVKTFQHHSNKSSTYRRVTIWIYFARQILLFWLPTGYWFFFYTSCKFNLLFFCELTFRKVDTLVNGEFQGGKGVLYEGWCKIHQTPFSVSTVVGCVVRVVRYLRCLFSVRECEIACLKGVLGLGLVLE